MGTRIACPPGQLVIDVSKWDDHLRPQELLDGGVISVIVGLYPVWNGSQYVLNTNCKRIADQVAASNLIMQAYYYVYPELDPYKWADWFAGIIHQYQYPVRFVWSDCEDYKALMTPMARSLSYQRFTDRTNTYFPKKTGIYTGKWYIDEFATDANGRGMNDWLPNYPSWVSHYGHQPLTATLMSWEELKQNWLPNYDIKCSPAQASRIVGHQFTGDKCYLPGVYCQYDALPWWPYKGRDKLDVSVFNPAFMSTISGGQVPTPAPTPVPAPANIYFVNIKLMNVRSSPDDSIDTNKIGVAPFQHRFIVDVVSGKWAHFLPQDGFPQGGWLWLAYLTKV